MSGSVVYRPRFEPDASAIMGVPIRLLGSVTSDDLDDNIFTQTNL